MLNHKYVINAPLDNKEINYPPMYYNEKEVPIRLVRLTNSLSTQAWYRTQPIDISRKIIYWTDDNIDYIINNLSKPKSREIYFRYNFIARALPFINPFESDSNCEKIKVESDNFEHYNYFNCYGYKYVYLLEFANMNDTQRFLDSYVDVNYTLPIFVLNNPFEFIYYITILGRRMNFFNMQISNTLTHHIYTKLIDNFKLLLNQAYTTFSQETLTILNGPYKFIVSERDKFIHLYNDTSPGLCYLLLGDLDYMWFGFIDHGLIELSHIKIQMNIKEEYLFWLVNKLIINLDRVISNNIVAFKFFHQNTKYIGNFSGKFPNEPNTVTSQFENYMYNGKQYKRERFYAPNVAFYLANTANIKNVIDLLYELFPNNEGLNHKIISNGIIPRGNFRVSENIFISIGGDNQNKNDISKPIFADTYIDANIPSEYKDIIHLTETYILTSEQCSIINKYTYNISGHDLLKYEHGKSGLNNILSYKGIIGNKGSFNNIFHELNLFDYYDRLFNSREFESFKENIMQTNPKKLSAGYKIKKISKRTRKQKKRISRK